MAWSRRKGGSKISKNQLPPLFFFQPTFLSSLSLPATSSALEDPTKTFLLHQHTTSQPPYEPKSSPAATARSSLSPLQIFFLCNLFFFLPQPNLATITLADAPPKPPAEPPHHARDPHTRQLSPPCFASFFFVVASTCWIHFCMQLLIN